MGPVVQYHSPMVLIVSVRTQLHPLSLLHGSKQNCLGVSASTGTQMCPKPSKGLPGLLARLRLKAEA